MTRVHRLTALASSEMRWAIWLTRLALSIRRSEG